MQKHWSPLIREKLQSSSNLFKLLVAQIYIYIHYLKHSWRIHKIRSRIMWFKWICCTGLLCQWSKFERPRALKKGLYYIVFSKQWETICIEWESMEMYSNSLEKGSRVLHPLKTLPVDASASQDYELRWTLPYMITFLISHSLLECSTTIPPTLKDHKHSSEFTS